MDSLTSTFAWFQASGSASLTAATTAATIGTSATASLSGVTLNVAWDNGVNTTALTSTYFNDLELTDTSGNSKAWFVNGDSKTLETYAASVGYKEVRATVTWPDGTTDAQKAALVGTHTFHIEASGTNADRVRFNDAAGTYTHEAIEFDVTVGDKAASYALSNNSVIFYVMITGGAGTSGADETYASRDQAAISASLKVVAGSAS